MRMQKLWCSSEEPFDFIQWIAENHRKGVLLISGTEMIDFLTTNLDLIYSPSLENDELEFQSKDFKIKLSFILTFSSLAVSSNTFAINKNENAFKIVSADNVTALVILEGNNINIKKNSFLLGINFIA